MYATSNNLSWAFLLLAVSFGVITLNTIGDWRDHNNLRDDVNSLQYEANQLNKHRHFIDENGTTSGTPIRADGSYLSGAWF